MDTGFPERSAEWRPLRWARAIWFGYIDIAVVRPVKIILSLLAALLLLFEEWGWQPLSRLISALALLRPIAALEDLIAGLPPYPALAVFAVPVVLLVPVKLGAVWLLANGHAVTAVAVLVAAKVVGTGLVARIYQLTEPQLMRIGWFARAYSAFMPWKEAAYAWVRGSWAWRWGRIGKIAAKRVIHRVRLAVTAGAGED